MSTADITWPSVPARNTSLPSRARSGYSESIGHRKSRKAISSGRTTSSGKATPPDMTGGDKAIGPTSDASPNVPMPDPLSAASPYRVLGSPLSPARSGQSDKAARPRSDSSNVISVGGLTSVTRSP